MSSDLTSTLTGRYLGEVSEALHGTSTPHLTLVGSLSNAEAVRGAMQQPDEASTDGPGAPATSIPWSPDEVLWVQSLSESFYVAQQAARLHLQQATTGWNPRRSTTDWDDARDDAVNKIQMVGPASFVNGSEVALVLRSAC